MVTKVNPNNVARLDLTCKLWIACIILVLSLCFLGALK